MVLSLILVTLLVDWELTLQGKFSDDHCPYIVLKKTFVLVASQI